MAHGHGAHLSIASRTQSLEAMMNAIQFASCALHLARRAPRLAAAAALLVLCGGAHAQQPQRAPEARIVVTGEGSVSVAPNYAQIRVGVTTRTKTVKDALGTNTRLMVAIIAALKDDGIAENDVQTARFSIQPIYTTATTLNSQDARAEPKLLSYSVSNHVNVTVREIGKVGDLLDRAVAAGATDVGNVSFLISDASKALDQARESAIADARRKAEVYAKASGVRLGGVEWITEDTGSGPPVPMMSRTAAAPVPITSGEDTLRVRVTVGFEIAR
jgi:uncharacterized protein